MPKSHRRRRPFTAAEVDAIRQTMLEPSALDAPLTDHKAAPFQDDAPQSHADTLRSPEPTPEDALIAEDARSRAWGLVIEIFHEAFPKSAAQAFQVFVALYVDDATEAEAAVTLDLERSAVEKIRTRGLAAIRASEHCMELYHLLRQGAA